MCLTCQSSRRLVNLAPIIEGDGDDSDDIPVLFDFCRFPRLSTDLLESLLFEERLSHVAESSAGLPKFKRSCCTSESQICSHHSLLWITGIESRIVKHSPDVPFRISASRHLLVRMQALHSLSSVYTLV